MPSTPNPLPTYIYKIVSTEPPSPLPATYPATGLDQRDGFVHLSTAAQVPVTAGFFFDTLSRIWIIKIRTSALADPIDWAASGQYPHLHGTFGADQIDDVRVFVRPAAQVWQDVLADQWLEG